MDRPSAAVDLHFPASIGVRDAGCFCLADLDWILSPVPTNPKCIRLAALQNHVVAEERADKGCVLGACGGIGGMPGVFWPKRWG